MTEHKGLLDKAYNLGEPTAIVKVFDLVFIREKYNIIKRGNNYFFVNKNKNDLITPNTKKTVINLLESLPKTELEHNPQIVNFLFNYYIAQSSS